jgi:hypothetical protein
MGIKLHHAITRCAPGSLGRFAESLLPENVFGLVDITLGLFKRGAAI